MTKQKREETKYSVQLPNARDLFDAAKTHRLVVTKSDGRTMLDLSVLVAVLLAVIMPPVAAIVALVALFDEATVEIVRTEADDNNTNITTG